MSPEVVPAQVYLICYEADLEQIVPVEDYLFDQGFEVIIPVLKNNLS